MDKVQKKVEDDVYKALKAPFDLSAYSIDSSRGFDLASLKAQYIPDRLNEVLGLTGWQFSGKFEEVMDGDKPTGGVLYHGVLKIKIGDSFKIVKGVGFSGKKKNAGDTRKGAMTDALSKAASHVGVADAAFKGLIKCGDIKKVMSGNTTSKPTAKKDAASFSKKNKKDKSSGMGW